MREILHHLEQLYNICHVPMTLMDDEGNVLGLYPEAARGITTAQTNASVIEWFRQAKLDADHPMIILFDPGFLLGIVEIDPRRYVLVGLVSPYAHSRNEILITVCEAIHPDHLSAYCDLLLQQPLMSLEQLRSLISLLTQVCERSVPEENILFVDNTSSLQREKTALDEMLFNDREEPESHVPVDFETAICSAIETGNRIMLEKTLFAPHPGRVGRMSSNELRQLQYAFICLATLVSRAAIRGGIPSEIAFSMSDLYCQRMDMLTDPLPIQNLVVTMLTDYCGKVQEIKRQPSASPVIRKCLSYISVHLHDTITVEALSRHVGLCSRSLSLKFKAEMGMGIPEFINREKLREAEYLLIHTDYSLPEITAYLNYSTQSHFTQVFKKYKHCTPQVYRDHHSP